MLFADLLDKRHRHIARNMIIVGMFIFVGKFAGAIKEATIAYKFGISSQIDQYVFVNTLVMLIPAMWVSISVAAFVPTARRMKRDNREFFSAELTGIILIASLILSALVYHGLGPLIDALPLGFNSSDHPELRSWTKGLAALCGGGLIVGMYSARLLVEERHANTLAEGIPALIIAILILIWPSSSALESLITGCLVGLTLHILFLAYLLYQKNQPLAPRFTFESPAWQGFRQALGLLLIGKIITSFVAPIDQAIAANLGAGSIATLNYANKLTGLLVGIGATAIGRAILPVLSDRDSSASDVVKMAKQWSAMLMMFGIVAASVTWWLSEPIVRVVFERGAFDAANSEAVNGVFRYGLLQLPFFFSSIVLVQLFASRGLYWVLLTTSVLTIIVKTSSSYFLSQSLGVAGISLGTGIMYLVNFSFLLFALRFIPTSRPA